MSDRPSQLDTECGETEPGAAPARRERVEIARGESLGRYVVLDVVGRGGMGAVYAAYDPELDRKLAIKLILAASDAGGRRALARLRPTSRARAGPPDRGRRACDRWRAEHLAE